MDQANIFAILNKHIFDKEKRYLVRSIVANSERFVGIFRSTTPRLKIIQNLLQSREIRFGDALQEIVETMLADMGFVTLPREIRLSGNKRMSLDQYFSDAHQNFISLSRKSVTIMILAKSVVKWTILRQNLSF